MTEPLTAVSDYVLAAAALIFAIRVAGRIDARNRVSARFWCGAFLAATAAATAGGTFHGFTADLDTGVRRALWNLAVFSMGACAAFGTAGIHSAYVQRKDGTVTWLTCGIAVTLLGAAVQQGWLLGGARFNRAAAYHLIQIVGLYFLFRSALTVHDRPGVPPRLT